MIVDLENTTISQVSKKLVSIREDGGAVALGRVLTLVIETDFAGIEPAIKAANDSSREHPCRVIVIADDEGRSDKPAKIDAQIRVGGDAGASEVIVLRAYGEAASSAEGLVTGLLLPDAPVVAWWPGEAPKSVANSEIGRIAQRRITDSAAQAAPGDFLKNLSETYQPGDSDFAWTRLTLWRQQLAVLLDQPPYEPVTSAEVIGPIENPSTDLLAAWLGLQLDVPVKITRSEASDGLTGIRSVKLTRASGETEIIIRDVPDVAKLIKPGQPVREVSLPLRTLRDCLSEDLRRLDPDSTFGKVLTACFAKK